MEYTENARKKFPKEQVQFMVGGAADALKALSGLNIPGIPAISDLTEKVADLQNIAGALQSGAVGQVADIVQNSDLATNISQIGEAAAIAQNVGGAVNQLDAVVKSKLDAAQTLAAAVSSPQKILDLASKAQNLMGLLNSTGFLRNAAQSFMGGQFVDPIKNALAGKMVDAQKVWELPSQYKAEYPHNKVTTTPSGHSIQLDDTPGEERIMVADKLGNYVEMGKDGVNIRCNSKMNITVGAEGSGPGEFSLRIKSKCDIHVDGDANIKVSGNMDGEVEGDSSMLVKGKCGLVVNGNASTLVKGNMGVHVAGKASVHSDGNMKVRTETAMIVESGTTMDVKSGGDMTITSGGTLDIKSAGNMTLKAPRIDLN